MFLATNHSHQSHSSIFWVYYSYLLCSLAWTYIYLNLKELDFVFRILCFLLACRPTSYPEPATRSSSSNYDLGKGKRGLNSLWVVVHIFSFPRPQDTVYMPHEDMERNAKYNSTILWSLSLSRIYPIHCPNTIILHVKVVRAQLQH